MIAGWILLLVSVLYVGGLFALAYYGDRRPLYPQRAWLRPIVYSLALAVYCSSWTFYGAVGSAARDGLSYLPIYLGPILLFVFGFGLFRRLVVVAKERNITSIADFIGSRFGKSHMLGALVTIIAVTAVVPYLALQLKAVTMSFDVMVGNGPLAHTPVLTDTALYIALLLAVFAILFGTRGINATEHHHGMMLAVAVESLVKLLAFVAVGIYALLVGGGLDTLSQPVENAIEHGLPTGFVAQTVLAFAAIFCLPRQFQVGVVECENTADLGRARWMFPLYLAIITVLVLPIVHAGAEAARGHAISADAYVLWLPLAHGERLLAVFAYIGGFSAATGMVIVASVALATMVSNDLVMPALLRIRSLRLEQRDDLSSIVLTVRRVTIIALGLLAFAYYRSASHTQNLASIGLLSFAAVAQFAPALIGGLYWRSASRIGVIAGLVAGFAVWAYTLLLPTLAGAGWLPTGWLSDGPFAIGWLRPHALFQLRGWDPLTHGAFWSLLFNVGFMVFVSLRFHPSVDERLRAAAFLEPAVVRPTPVADWRGRVTVADLRAIAERIVGEDNTTRAFAEYAQTNGKPLAADAYADRALLQYTERLLAGAVGAASARRMLTTALRGTGLDLSEAVAMLDEASQELRFNRELLAVTFENMMQGISVVDADLRIVAWNRRYLDFFDYPEGFVYVGRPVADLIRHNAARGLLGGGDSEEQVWRRLGHLRSAQPHVFLRTRADGRVIETRGDPLPGGGYLTTFTDVTAYKRDRAGADRSQRDARAARRAAHARAVRGADRAGAGQAAGRGSEPVQDAFPRRGQPRSAAAAQRSAAVHLGAAPSAAARRRVRAARRAHRHRLQDRRGSARRAARSLASGCRQVPRRDRRRFDRRHRRAAQASVRRAGRRARYPPAFRRIGRLGAHRSAAAAPHPAELPVQCAALHARGQRAARRTPSRRPAAHRGARFGARHHARSAARDLQRVPSRQSDFAVGRERPRAGPGDLRSHGATPWTPARRAVARGSRQRVLGRSAARAGAGGAAAPR